MTTYELPPEPPVGTRVTDEEGRTWTLDHAGWWTAPGEPARRWWGVLFYGPLTEVPDPALPARKGALIIASGVSDGEPFENKALMWDREAWYGAVKRSFATPDEITSWTEAVAVPKDALDALREHNEGTVCGSVGVFFCAVDGVA